MYWTLPECQMSSYRVKPLIFWGLFAGAGISWLITLLHCLNSNLLKSFLATQPHTVSAQLFPGSLSWLWGGVWESVHFIIKNISLLE